MTFTAFKALIIGGQSLNHHVPSIITGYLKMAIPIPGGVDITTHPPPRPSIISMTHPCEAH
ncbi:hypothetical protein AMTR_s00098p00071190 [Amborella trichopoda]|uniref:Uncharacterized protein n=1 Tax=Amborella trichopoda TaxID=13333 RepID=W1NS36_AMBTC|nr:hypothetical protein AMTR_s00098p00071190 [Amborella trichopoda]